LLAASEYGPALAGRIFPCYRLDTRDEPWRVTIANGSTVIDQ